MSESNCKSDAATFIEPVSPPELSKASSKGQIDESSQAMRDLEWRHYIRGRRAEANRQSRNSDDRLTDRGKHAPADLTGIALSGGGIRSATFALGVLQALAHHDLLRRFDYLSTVSGGGYIGSSLTWLTSSLATERAKTDQKQADEASEAAAGEAVAVVTADATADDDPPQFPEHGFGLGPSREPNRSASPAARAGDAPPFPYGSDDPRNPREPDGSQAEDAMLGYLRQHGNYLTPGEGITLTSVLVVLLRGIVLNFLVWIPILAALMWFLISASLHWLPVQVAAFVGSISPPLRQDATGSPKLVAFGIMLAAAGLAFGACVVAYACYSLATYTRHGADESWLWWLRRKKYSWRRAFETWMRWPLWGIAVLALVASVPFVVGNFYGWVAGSSFSLVGLASGLIAFARAMQPRKSKADREAGGAIPGTWVASIGAAFLLYGVLLLAYAFAWWATEGAPVLGVVAPSCFLGGAFLVALATGWFVDLNLVTVHRFYRDRLMEAFLPDIRQALRNQTAPAEQADSAALSSMCDPKRPWGPYHIINTNLVLIRSDQRTYRLRGGDSFILSPLYCGSNATGWQPTKHYSANELTLPTAMAISGAAANPWTASGGIGVMRHPLVGVLMALMNLRLGFWVPNPSRRRTRLRGACQERFRPNHFEPGLKEVLGISLRERSPVCLLSDGGHFENLGLYELIRRRLRLILVCDGTADPDYAFADLQNALARIAADFGARVEFDQQTTLQRFMPSIDAVYPKHARLSESAYAIAQIIYSDGRTGHLVYLTTALCKGLRLRLLGYKGAHPDFPDQSTADQFFDEEQFEAYRELGYVIADNFIRHDMQNGGMLGQSIRTRIYPQAAA